MVERKTVTYTDKEEIRRTEVTEKRENYLKVHYGITTMTDDSIPLWMWWIEWGEGQNECYGSLGDGASFSD
jgi:hypothetical protein